MNDKQKEALNRSTSYLFTKEDAKHVLNLEFGSTPIKLGHSHLRAGVVNSIRLLGGEYDYHTGITELPKYQPVDEV